MTTIRGKDPLQLNFTPKVSADIYADRIKIESGLWQGGQRVEAFGLLSPHCARDLILNLRKALREIRDNRVRELNQQVADAEKPLP